LTTCVSSSAQTSAPRASELFLVGTSVISPLLPGGDGRFGDVSGNASGFITVGQLLNILPAVRTNIEANALNCNLPTSIECFGTVSGPIFSSDFEVPYSIQYAFGVQRELPWNMLLQADFNYRKGLHEVLTYDVNQADSANGPVNPLSPFPVPYADSSAYSTYKALLVRVDRRFDRGFQMTGSYSFARLNGFGNDALGLGQIGTDLNNLRKEFGPAALDRTHRFVLSSVWDMPFFSKSSSWAKRNLLGNWNVSFISTAFSGLPFSAFLPHDADLSGTGTFLSYLPGTQFGQLGRSIQDFGRTEPAHTRIQSEHPDARRGLREQESHGALRRVRRPAHDARRIAFGPLARRRLAHLARHAPDQAPALRRAHVSLDLIGEVFNLFNVANYRDEANVVQVLDDGGQPRGFLQPSSRATSVFGTGGPRAFQFAVKLRF
jgi:hypothetical protein